MLAIQNLQLLVSMIADSIAIEAQSVSLSEADDSLEIEDEEE